MIALFMVYGVAVTALLVVVSHLAEKCLTTFGRPTRAVWVACLSLAVYLLAIGMLGRRVPSIETGSSRSGALLVATDAAPMRVGPPSPSVSTRLEFLSIALRRSDAALMWLWATGSVASFAGIVLLVIQARRMVKRAKPTVLAGAPVLVTHDVGPALAGIVKYDIVVPPWVLDLPAEQQSLIVAHERQHADAFDPLPVWITALAIVAFPWNISLWYLMRRLRTSIEVDCDHRVLARSFSAHAYASLLVDVGARVSSRPLFAAALSESASQLQRRIRAMSSGRPPLARTRAVVSAVAAFLVLGAAFRAPRPVESVLGRSQNARPTTTDGRVVLSAKKNIAEVSVESRSVESRERTQVYVLIYTTKSARIAVGQLSAKLTSDTLQLRTPVSFTADLTDGEVHIVSVGGTPLDVTAVFHDSPASNATAHNTHIILEQGGTGIGSRSRLERAPEPPGEPYFEFQVEKPVEQIPGTGSPFYPSALRSARVEGEVQAQFVVNGDGNVEPSTFKVLKATDDRFVAAVRATLPAMRFHPAEVGGKHVRQLVQQSFQFKLDRGVTSGPRS